MICPLPFTHTHVYCHNGLDIVAFACCPVDLAKPFGTVDEDSPFEDVWNSEQARSIRRMLLRGDYSLCNLNVCATKGRYISSVDFLEEHSVEYSEAPSAPVIVKFCHDKECNIHCTMCRDSRIINSDHKLAFLNSKIDSVFLPMVKNAKAVYMAGDGDPFFSRHYRTLIKRIRAVYPDKLFLLHTNGQLCNEKHCRELDLLSNIHSVIVSINAARENTYERIMCGARWKTLIKNLDFLLACREKGLLKKIFFSFVIQKSNYKEMAEFSEWAGSMDIEVRFTRRYRDKNTLHYDDEVTIFDEKNPDFKEFAHMLQHPALKTPLCWLDPESMSYLKHACK